MNPYPLILLNILLTCFVYLLLDHRHQLVPYKTETQCIKTNATNILCAECFKRDQNLLHNRGVKIKSNKEISLLKIKDLQTYMTCHDYLQLIHPQPKRNPTHKITIQPLSSISSLLAEINGVLQVQNERSNHVIQPWYNQLVIYRYEQKISKQSTIVFPNPDSYQTFELCFKVGFNFLLLFLGVLIVSGKILLRKYDKLVNILFVCIALLMELFALDVQADFCVFIARAIVLNLAFILNDLDSFKVLLSFTFGLFLGYYQITNLFYLASLLIFLIIQQSKTASNTHTYLFTMYTLIFINHAYHYLFTLYFNDLINIVIDVCLIVLTPLGLMLLGNQGKETYQQVDSGNKPNQLNEYQQQPNI